MVAHGVPGDFRQHNTSQRRVKLDLTIDISISVMVWAFLNRLDNVLRFGQQSRIDGVFAPPRLSSSGHLYLALKEYLLRVSFSNHLELDKALRTVLDVILRSFHRPKVHLYYSTKIESLIHSYLQKPNLTMNFYDQSVTPEALTTDPKNLSTTSITKLIKSVLYSFVMFQSDSEPDESQQAAKRWSNSCSGVRNKSTWV